MAEFVTGSGYIEIKKGLIMDKNLISFEKLRNNYKALRMISFLFSKEKRDEINQNYKKMEELVQCIEEFTNIFSDAGWCIYDSINTELMRNAVKEAKENGIESGEKLLIEYYTVDIADKIQWLWNKAKPFECRRVMLEKAFADHFSRRYYASIPLFLIIVDGAVNDYTKNKGLFAEGTNVTAWDCLVGCSDSLTKIKTIFSQKRTKTNSEEIRIPYRNGILHGRDLNYANEYVSCKCVALLFALADWMSFKDSEDRRKEKYFDSKQNPKLIESIKRIRRNREDKKQIKGWRRREIVLGETISDKPQIADCSSFPYLIPIIETMEFWEKRNYGRMSERLAYLFPDAETPSAMAGECRKLFASKKLVSYKILEVKEESCIICSVSIQVEYLQDEEIINTVLKWGCLYQNKAEKIAYPWNGDGEWVLMPRDVSGLYGPLSRFSTN